MRAVSLVPSLTETLFALGAGDDVVGVTDFCIFPENLDRPRIGGTKTPKIDRIRELAPDVVYVNIEENLKKHADEIAKFSKVIATEPKTIEDVIALIEMLGREHGREKRARELADELRAANREPRAPFTFVVPIWKKPWMWCGGDTYVSNLVESAGGRNLLRGRQRYPAMAIEEVLALKPDVVFLPDEPYEFTQADADSIAAPHPPLRGDLSRGRGLSVIGPFPGHLFTWHGVRTIEGLKFLRQALRPLRPTV